MATSASGSEASEQGVAPLDAAVSMNIEVKENPKIEIKHDAAEQEEQQQRQPKLHQVGFSMSRDKFLQFSKDMKHALVLLKQTQKVA